jgi:hypothetical protein
VIDIRTVQGNRVLLTEELGVVTIFRTAPLLVVAAGHDY